MLKLSLLFVVSSMCLWAQTTATVSLHNPFYCYTQDPVRPQIGMFATKSTYETNRGRNIDPTVSSCSPSRFWLLSRHGTRLPSASEMRRFFEYSENLQQDILRNYEAGRTSLCHTDVELIRQWRLNPAIELEREQHLMPAGWDELEGLAQRFQAAFPDVLVANYSSSDYFFRTTDRQRTQMSLNAFADGLFGVNGHQQVVFEEIPDPDFLLRPHDGNCPLYDQVARAAVEQNAFLEGPEYEQMIEQVSHKLGFQGSRMLRPVQVDVLASLCKFEQIWDMNTTSPFCAAFSIANHEVLEYHEDLDYYYRVGYGLVEYRTLYENMNCHLVQDMLRFLQSNDPTDHKARIFSTHSSILQLIIVTLGVFEDEVPLTRHNFAQQAFRLWKSSLVAPMGTNLAVIRYDCADGDNDFLFLFNEKPIHIAGCQSNGLCKQSLIMERFSRFIDADCSQLFCSNSTE